MFVIRMFLICLGSLSMTHAFAEETSLKEVTPHITITGSAHTDVVPDLAIISVSVSTERPTATAAANDNATAGTAIVSELKAEGVEEKDISTVSVTLAPVYDESRDGTGHVIKRTLRGYQARNSINVRMRELDKAGNLARHLIEKGANSFGGISFEIEHPEEQLKALEAEAARDALARAQNYASALGFKLGRVIEIAPDEGARPQYKTAAAPVLARMANSDSEPAQAAIPIEPGVRTLQATLTVTWEISQ